MTRTKIIRIVTASLGIVVVVSGAVGELRYGGIDSLGAWDIWITCPLGFLERSLAAREWLPQWQSALVAVFSVILLGRVFCAWVCPSVLLRRVFARGNGSLGSKQEAAPQGATRAAFSPYAFLGGALVASFVFQFPVFCFVCPIGLFFGSLYAVIRLFSPHDLNLELVIFPVLLGLELWGLKSWCRSICPLGALLSIISSLNRLLLPVVNRKKCLTSKGISCGACEQVCPEGIDLRIRTSRFLPNSCTKCLECSDRCPAKAIKFPLLNLKKSRPRKAAALLAAQQQ